MEQLTEKKQEEELKIIKSFLAKAKPIVEKEQEEVVIKLKTPKKEKPKQSTTTFDEMFSV